MKRLAAFVLAALIIVAGIIIFNTIRYSRPISSRQSLPLPALGDSAISHMSEAVSIKTISFADSLPVDTAAYTQFRSFIERAYPLITQNLPRKTFNQFSYLYAWEGKNKSLAPYVLMAHSDVVPVEEATISKWTVPPFSGQVKDSMIWGRGVIDDKGCLIPILEAVEALLRDHFQPERTIYLSFGHDEEISGPRGAAAIAQWFRQQKIRPELVLDEGGEITLEQFPEVKRPVAAIAVAEKGYLSFQLRVEKPGGHSSMPAHETAIDILTKALTRLREKEMPFRMTIPIEECYRRIGADLSIQQRVALSNPWLPKSFIQMALDRDQSTNALFRTTIVPTIVSAGLKDNIIPAVASATVNCRNLPGENQADVIAFIKDRINDPRVKIYPEKINIDASPVTDIHGKAYLKIEQLCYDIMPNVIPVPYMLTGGTDSRHFDDISDGVIKFAPSLDGKGYHGIDERLPIADFRRMVFFYQLLIKRSAE